MTQIDTSRRGFLKSAVAASAAMMSAAAVHAGIPAKSVAKYDETFDVVIIGSGFAGMACALKAGRAGLKVLMIEKMSTVGGNSASAAATSPARSTRSRRPRASRTARSSSSPTA